MWATAYPEHEPNLLENRVIESNSLVGEVLLELVAESNSGRLFRMNMVSFNTNPKYRL